MWRTSGDPVSPKARAPSSAPCAVDNSTSVRRNFRIEADFLTPFQLDYPPVVDHELDGAVAQPLEGLLELPEKRRRQWDRIVWPGVSLSRKGRVSAHDPI